MDISLLSRYRQELMGLAMLMVVFHHLTIPQCGSVMDFLHSNGGFGVDIFLLLSGMGLYYSTRKGLNLRTFLYIRLVRIFPLYILVVVSVALIKGQGVVDILYMASTLGYWLGKPCYDWFIPTIVVLYMLYPVFHWTTFGREHGVAIGVGVCVVMYAAFFLLPYGGNFQMWMRWPTFFLGSVVGMVIFDGKYKRRLSINGMGGVITISFCIGIILSVWAFIHFREPNIDAYTIPDIKKSGWLFKPYFLVVLCFCCLMASCVDKIRMDLIRSFLAMIGSMSLEVYLLHGQFIVLARTITNEYSLSKPLVGGGLVIISFFVAWLLHYLNTVISKRL